MKPVPSLTLSLSASGTNPGFCWPPSVPVPRAEADTWPFNFCRSESSLRTVAWFFGQRTDRQPPIIYSNWIKVGQFQFILSTIRYEVWRHRSFYYFWVLCLLALGITQKVHSSHRGGAESNIGPTWGQVSAVLPHLLLDYTTKISKIIYTLLQYPIRMSRAWTTRMITTLWNILELNP